MKKFRKKTLETIAVVIVLAILVFLAFFLKNLNEAQDRDMKRITDLNNLRSALQFYYLDNGHYPIEKQWCSLELNCDTLSKEIKSYLPEIPKDPLFPKKKGYSYLYRTTENGSDYKICAKLETDTSYELGSKKSFLILSPAK